MVDERLGKGDQVELRDYPALQRVSRGGDLLLKAKSRGGCGSGLPVLLPADPFLSPSSTPPPAAPAQAPAPFQRAEGYLIPSHTHLAETMVCIHVTTSLVAANP